MYVYDIKLHLDGVTIDMPESIKHLFVVSKAEMASITLELLRHKEHARKEEAGSVKSWLDWFRREEGHAMDRCIEHLGIDKRTGLRKLGNKEAERRAFWNRRVGIVKKHEVFQRQYFKKGTKFRVFKVNIWDWSATCPSLPLSIGFGHVRKKDGQWT